MELNPDRVREHADAYTDAWNSGRPEAVASFFTENGQIEINRGDPWQGRAEIAEMAAGFFADVPDLTLTCDALRCAGDHVAYFWTFTGTHSGTGNRLKVSGWEEWDFESNLKVRASRGWFDADDYARQTGDG